MRALFAPPAICILGTGKRRFQNIVPRANVFVYFSTECVSISDFQKSTVCPGSSNPFYIETHYINWGTTSWTHSRSKPNCQRTMNTGPLIAKQSKKLKQSYKKKSIQVISKLCCFYFLCAYLAKRARE